MTFNPKFLNTSVVPKPDDYMIIVSKYLKKSIKNIREEAFFDFGHTDRHTYAISSLNFLFALPPTNFDAGATTVTTYLSIENYTFYRKTYNSSPPLHTPSLF